MTHTYLGRRLTDAILGAHSDAAPGSYWKVVSARKGGRPLTPADLKHTVPPGANEPNTVWEMVTPNGLFALLTIHTVRENSDRTVSVLPGDGGSNSILVEHETGSTTRRWHGYIRDGVWEALDDSTD